MSKGIKIIKMLIQNDGVSSGNFSTITESEFKNAYDNGKIYFSFQEGGDVSTVFFILDSLNYDRLFSVFSHVERGDFINSGFNKEEKFNESGITLENIRIYFPS